MKVCSVCRRCYDNFDTVCTEAAHPPLSETHQGGREIVEGYSLDLLLESGLRGEVFRAHQLATSATCIVRMITTSETERERSVREAKVAGSIFHPNVADVYEAGTLDTGQVYVVSEYPTGQTLRELLNKVRVPDLLTAIQILSQTADALHTLHQNGITHNAVRPENIVLTTDPDGCLQVRVTNVDFGGVGFRSIISNKFLIDSALDSLRYFAPEQCTGESAGPQTDVYSLGIVFYEMLAGRPPFNASTATALIQKQKNERPPDVRIANFQLRMLLTHTLMESLQKQPMYRPASADKFARQMRHMEQLATHVSTPPPAGAMPEAPAKPAPAFVAPNPLPASRPTPVVVNVPEPVDEPAPVRLQETVSTPQAEAKQVNVQAPALGQSPLAVPEPVSLVGSVAAPSPEVEPSLEVHASTDWTPEPLELPVPGSEVDEIPLADSIPDPLPLFAASEPVLTPSESYRVALTDSIPDPLPVVAPKPVPEAAMPVEPVTPAAIEPVELAHDGVNRTARRSRLKTWKKKLHALNSSTSKATQAEKSALVVDTPEIATHEVPAERSVVESPATDGKRSDALTAAAKPTDDKLEFVAPAVEEQIPELRFVISRRKDDNLPFVVTPQTRTLVRETSADDKLKFVIPANATENQLEQVDPTETRQTEPTDAPVRRKAAKRPTTQAKLPAAAPPTPAAVKADPVKSDIVTKPASVETATPPTMEPPRLVVEERVVQARKITWDQPDDDIPSEADVLDVLVKDGVIGESEKYTGHVFTVTTPKSADGPLVATSANPPAPVVQAKSADGPVLSPARNARTERSVPPLKKPAAQAEAKSREAITRRTPQRQKTPTVVDQEEITLVRPPRQIRIDLDPGPARNARRGGFTPPRPTRETDFFPTLLGESERPSHIQPAPTEAMFSTYYSAPVKKTAIPYRTVMFGGGVLVLVVTFLIGDGFVGDHVQSKNESVASRTTSAQRAKKIPPMSVKPLEKPREESVVDENELKPLPENDRLTRTVSDKPVTVERTAAVKKDAPKATSRDYSPAPRPVPPPTPATSKKKSEPAQQPRAIGIKSSPAQTNPNIATRPRIVKEPK